MHIRGSQPGIMSCPFPPVIQGHYNPSAITAAKPSGRDAAGHHVLSVSTSHPRSLQPIRHYGEGHPRIVQRVRSASFPASDLERATSHVTWACVGPRRGYLRVTRSCVNAGSSNLRVAGACVNPRAPRLRVLFCESGAVRVSVPSRQNERRTTSNTGGPSPSAGLRPSEHSVPSS